MSRASSWAAVWRINGRFLGATVAGSFAWIAWTLASPEWWGLGLIAVLCALGAVFSALGGLAEIIRLFWQRREVARYERLGNGPRSDPMATPRDLKARGLTR